MNVLLIGYGSIGARHASLLAEKNHTLTVVSRNPECPFQIVLPTIDDALAQGFYDAALVANPTASHYEALLALRNGGFRGPVLVEKPLFDCLPKALDAKTGEGVHVAYNLRQHPLLQRMKSILEGRTLYSAMAYVGQYLPDWRPGRDYRLCYSAHKEQGGGVLRDLSHELDYLQWITSPWKAVTAIGGHFSHLEISSDDVFGLMWRSERCPLVQVELNYLDRAQPARREVIVNAEGMTVKGDLIAGALTVNNETPEYFSLERNRLYRSQLTSWLSGEHTFLCSFADALNTVALIEAAETAAATETWVSR